MVKFIKFIFVGLFIFSFTPVCMGADKGMSNNPTQESVSSEFPIAYEFKLHDLKGGEVSLSSYRNRKPVLLVFWTTWCPYCRAALKSLQADYKSIDSMGVEILAINVGEPKNRVINFVESYRLSFQVLFDQDSSVADQYDLLGVPTYVIINKSGRIVSSGNSFPRDRLKELVKG